MDGGIALLELANQAGELFERQPAGEKRRLLEFLLSNSYWADGELTPQFRQPFDLLRVTVAAGAQKKAAGELSSDQYQEELPRKDSNRCHKHGLSCDCR